MSAEPFAIVVGVGQVYIAAVGTTFPDTDETPGASWTDLGSTDDDGVTVTHVREYATHYKGNSPIAQKLSLSAAQDELAFNLKEVTPERYAKLLENVSVTSVAAGSGTPGTRYFRITAEQDVPQFAMLIRGPSPLSDADMQYEYPRTSPMDAVEIQYQKTDSAMLACKYMALEDTANAGRIGTFRAQAAVAL